MAISLKDHFGEDAAEIKGVLMQFGGQGAEIVSFGTPKSVPTQVTIDTCRASVRALEPHKSKYRKMIYEFIKGSLGQTCDEIEVALGLRHQTASCFIRFLTQDGLLRDSGDRRITRSGRQAIVWQTV